MFFSLAGKVAVVTGAASGIGRATVARFLAAGARVIAADISPIEIPDSGDSLRTMRVDVSCESEVEALMQSAVANFEGLDIVVNNAGIGEGAELADTTEALFEKTMAINAKSVLFGMKYGAAAMRDGGSIINTASGAGFIGFPTYGAYGASKAAVIMLTRTGAIELGPRGIRVNACCPGTINTAMQQSETGQAELAVSELLAPTGRIGEPEEVAALYHFLASDDSAFISGTIIPVDGGISAGVSAGTLGTLLTSVSNEI